MRKSLFHLQRQGMINVVTQERITAVDPKEMGIGTQKLLARDGGGAEGTLGDNPEERIRNRLSDLTSQIPDRRRDVVQGRPLR